MWIYWVALALFGAAWFIVRQIAVGQERIVDAITGLHQAIVVMDRQNSERFPEFGNRPEDILDHIKIMLEDALSERRDFNKEILASISLITSHCDELVWHAKDTSINIGEIGREIASIAMAPAFTPRYNDEPDLR